MAGLTPAQRAAAALGVDTSTTTPKGMLTPAQRAAAALGVQNVAPPAPPSTKRTFEVAKDAHGEPRRANWLRDLTDRFEIPMEYLDAAFRQGYGNEGELGKLTKMLQEGRFSDAAEEYGLGTKAQLEYYAQHGDPQTRAYANFMLKHPLLNAGATFVGEFANPSNIAAGEVIGAGLRGAGAGVRAARAASPAIDKALHAAGAPIRGLSAVVSRYAPVTQKGGKPYGDWAISMDRRADAAVRRVQKVADQVFGHDLTPAQKNEVVKLSYEGTLEPGTGNVGDIIRPDLQHYSAEHPGSGVGALRAKPQRLYQRDPNVPEPKSGLSLEERAKLYRQEYRRVTPLLRKYNLLDEQFDTGTYDPRAMFGGRPVYAHQDIQPVEGLEPLPIKSRAGRGSKFSSTSIAKRGHRNPDTLLLHEMNEGELSPQFDAAHQFVNDLTEKYRKIENEIGKRQLETVVGNVGGKSAAMAARVPVLVQQGEHVFGRGEQGVKALKSYIAGRAGEHAFEQAAKDPEVAKLIAATGMKPEEVAAARALQTRLGSLRSRISEARTNEAQAGKLADYVEKRYAAAQGSIGGDLWKQLNDRAKEVDKLNAAIEKAQSGLRAGEGGAAVKQFDAMVRERNKYLGDVGRLAERVERSMGNVASAGAHTTETALNGVQRVADQQLGKLERDSANVYARKGRLLKPTEDIANTVGAKRFTTAARTQSLAARETHLKDVIAARDAFDAKYEEAFERIKDEIGKQFSQAVKTPEGYVLEKELEVGSPSAIYKALDQNIFDFLKSNPRANVELSNPEARNMFRYYGLLNQLSRASIVWLPVVHAVDNLGMHYVASGGKPTQMLKILMGKRTFSPQMELRAERAGATAPTRTLFGGGESAHEAYTPASQLVAETKGGPLAKAIKGVEIGTKHRYEAFNNWLFDNVERGYRIDTFERLVKGGMSDGDAAREVNAAFGRVGDLSEAELAARANRIFYFYPWMKTVVGYWAKKGIADPKWWSTPTRAIEVNNQQQGFDDPSHPFTMTLGRRPNGDWRRYVVPLPQRVVGTLADVARLPVDVAQQNAGGFWEDAKSPLNFLTGHLNTALALGKDAYDAVSAAAGGRPPAPWNTFSGGPAQIAGRVAQRVFAPIGTLARAPEDPLGIGLAYPVGGFMYGTPSEQKKLAEHAVKAESGKATSELRKAIKAAQGMGLSSEVTRLQRALDDLNTAQLKALQDADKRALATP